MERKNTSSNVERAVQILLVLGDAPEGLALSQIAEAVNDTRSVVHRALAGLSAYGFVRQPYRRGRYTLGPAIYGLAMKSHTTSQLARLLRPSLVHLSRKTGAAIYLMVRSGQDSLCIDFEEGQLPFQPLVTGIGGRLPLGVGAASICMLAAMNEKTRDLILTLNEEGYSAVTTKQEILDKIEMAKTRGYVTQQAYRYAEQLTIAVPVPHRIARTECAISVIYPARDPSEADAIAAEIMASFDMVETESAQKPAAETGAATTRAPRAGRKPQALPDRGSGTDPMP